jgi:hypothetical protein
MILEKLPFGKLPYPPAVEKAMIKSSMIFGFENKA